MFATEASPVSIAALSVLLSVVGLITIGLGLFLAVRGDTIRERFLVRMSAGVVGHLRAYGILIAVMGFAFMAVGLGNIGSTL